MVEQLNSLAYQPPVSGLLSYGDCNKLDWKTWPDYVTELGLTQADVPELIRMMTDTALWKDSSDTLAPWGVVHAWRSLAQLKAQDAIQPFIELVDRYDDDDWLMMEAFRVLALYGSEVLPLLTQHLNDTSHVDLTRSAIAEGIENISIAEPEQRDRCIEILTQQLSQFTQNSKYLNGSLIGCLVALEAIEAAPLMEQAYAAKAVDDSTPGTWASVQVDLGLKQESDFSPEDFKTQLYKNMQARRLLQNSSYEEEDWPAPQFAPGRSSSYFSERPPKFGEGFLQVPKTSTQPSSQGFGSGTGKGKKKKK